MKVIAAVSGGVDSAVMLHKLVQQLNAQSSKLKEANSTNSYLPSPISQITVAHVDHGWRKEAAADARFVEGLAKKYGCTFEGVSLSLASTSEDEARRARWQFLHEMKQKYEADAIATAHHRDDVIETMALNILRGTSRRGLTSLKESADYLRPLLEWSKEEIYHYACKHRLEWVEDWTNFDEQHLRNKIRARLFVRLDPASRMRIIAIYKKMLVISRQLDTALEEVCEAMAVDYSPQRTSVTLDRSMFNSLPYTIQKELSAFVIARLQGVSPAFSLEVEQLALALKTARPRTTVGVTPRIQARQSIETSEVFLQT